MKAQSTFLTALFVAACSLSSTIAKPVAAQTSLVVEVNRSTISESDGPQAITATVTRSGDTSNSLTVNLSARSATVGAVSPLTLPSSVTIPVGASSVSFFIGALEDNAYDNFERVIVSFSSSTEAVEKEVRVLDVTPILSIAVNRKVVSETAGRFGAIGTVTRNGIGRTAVSVRLGSSRPDLLKVPATAVILPGRRFTTFPIMAINNKRADGNQVVVLSMATNFYPSQIATIPVTFLDDETGGPASTVAISSASAGAASNSIQLVFTGALSEATATFAGNYQIRVFGVAVDAESAGYNAATRTVTLFLPSGSIDAGDPVSVEASQLRDAQGRLIPNRRIIVNAR